MHFTLLLKTLGVSLLCSTSIRADDLRSRRNDSLRSDMHCRNGSKVSFIHNSYTFNAPVDKFINITKSFFDQSWYVSNILDRSTPAAPRCLT
jgi:hypothetical protein